MVEPKQISNKDMQQIQKHINFAGYTWIIKDSYQAKVGPGPNYFSSSDQSVWIDPSGHLHLTIRQQNDKWYCSELILNQKTGYGTYSLSTSPNVASIDQNAVLGIFTYETDEKEIDIQWSRWGKAINQNCQFVVQPGTEDSVYRQSVDLKGGEALSRFRWAEKEVAFQVASSKGVEQEVLMRWKATNPPVNIPKTGEERFRINLWLVKGIPPTQGKGTEMVIKSFDFKPE